MGYQKDIAEENTTVEAHYSLALKGNHRILHGEVERFMADAQACGFEGANHDCFEQMRRAYPHLAQVAGQAPLLWFWM